MRAGPPAPYAALPSVSRNEVATSALPASRALMNELTTVVASSSGVGSAGSAGAVAAQIDPPRVNTKLVPFGAQSGEWNVPLASLARFEPSGRTWSTSVSPPIKIASWLDQLASPEGRVACVVPLASATTRASAVKYMSCEPPGDQPWNVAPVWPSCVLLPLVRSRMNRLRPCV